MKKITCFFAFCFLLFACSLSAQNRLLTLGSSNNTANATVLTLQNAQQTTIRFDLNQLELVETTTHYGTAYIPKSDKAPLMLQEGAPELFYLTASIIIPDRGDSELEISYHSFQDFENVEIAPSKGNLTRSIDPNSVPFVKGEVYQIDGFFPGTLASLREPFIMRDVRGQSVDVFPVQYNPVTKLLRVYSEITITVVSTENEGINEFTTQKRHHTMEPAFQTMYENLFINYSSHDRGYPTSEEGELLIICHTPFMDAMKPYIDWKRTIGRKTTIVSTATTGTTNVGIKNYIRNYYNNPNHNLAYVLLVGDAPQIPVFSAGGTPSDITYGQLVGTDPFLEVLVGRMSAETIAHVQTQVQRSIEYERDIAQVGWISNAIGLAANELGYGPNAPGGHDGQENDYRHMDSIRARLLRNGYTTVYQAYSGPSIPNSSAAQITQHFNSGVSLANYCNHGSITAWTLYGGLDYTNAHVNQLQNADKLPYIFSVACLNGRFTTEDGPCFAETWMRATQNNKPTGAVATLMASISLSWTAPMSAQDEFVNICLGLPSPYGQHGQAGIKRTFAGAALNATQKMLFQHGINNCLQDYLSWTVFGDPTLMFRTKNPQEMTISHLPEILNDAQTYPVNCNADGALATLSFRNERDDVIIVGSATVKGGVAEITLKEPLPIPLDLTLAVTGFNKKTYLGTVLVVPPAGPYIIHHSHTLVGVEKLTYTSTYTEIEVSLINYGNAPTTGPITVNFSCSDPQLTINKATVKHSGIMAPKGTATVKFAVTVAHSVQDGTTFPVDLTITSSGKTTWISKLILKAHAPKFSLEKVLINNIENGSLEKGALAKITAIIANKGGADAYMVIGKLGINSPYITMACDEINLKGEKIRAGEIKNFNFYVNTANNTPLGHSTNINLLLSAQYALTYQALFTATCPGVTQYCMPASTTCSSNDKFSSVKLIKTAESSNLLINNTNNTCVTNGYSDFTHLTATLTPGTQYTISGNVVAPSNIITGWIDWNGNYSFDENEKVIYSTTNNFSQTFTVPVTATPGEHRLRLRTRFNKDPGTCDGTNSTSTFFGQTHDYTIIIPNSYPYVKNVNAVLNESTKKIAITWVAPDEGTPVGYNIYRDDKPLNTTPLTVTNFTDTYILGGTYVYCVTAVYAGNKESLITISNFICISPQFCEKPVNLFGIPFQNTAYLRWEKSENADGELLGYNIYRNDIKINNNLLDDPEYCDNNLTNGTYKYKISAVYSHCEESELTDGVNVTINFLNINEQPAPSFNLYPNPATNEIRITNYELRITSIAIYDVYGKNVSTHPLITSSSNHLINVSHLQSGIYFVRIYSENNAVVTKKLVIMR
jgi:hypothetical protein